MGRKLRPTENVAAVAARQPNGPLAVPPLRLPLHPPLLLPPDRLVQEDQEDLSAAEPSRAASVARVLLLLRNEEFQLRQDDGQPDLRSDPVGQEPGSVGQVG